jgi:hypothetical protein
MRIHQAEFAVEFCLLDIPENRPTDRARARASPDQRDRPGRKQIFQTISGHQFDRPAGASLDIVNRDAFVCATDRLSRHDNPP